MARIIADIGNARGWETWKRAGFQVDLENPPQSDLKFEELLKIANIRPEERGGLYFFPKKRIAQEDLAVGMQALVNNLQENISEDNHRYRINEEGQKCLKNLKRGIDCGLLNSETIHAPLHRLHITVATEKPTLLGILNCIEKTILGNERSALTHRRFYHAAFRLLISDSRGMDEVNEFFRSLAQIQDFTTPEWRSIQESSVSYQEIRTIVRTIFVDNINADKTGTPKQIDKYLNSAQCGLQCGLFQIGEINGHPRRSATLRAIAIDFSSDSISYLFREETFKKFNEHLTLGLKFGLINIFEATELKTHAEACLVDGKIPFGWKNSEAGEALLSRITELKNGPDSTIWPSICNDTTALPPV